MAPSSEDFEHLLARLNSGDSDAAEELFPLVYEELRSLAKKCFRGRHVGHTLQPTALVNEVFLKLLGKRVASWNDKTHFFAVAAKAMRQILINHAEKKAAPKRGGGKVRVPLHENVAAVSERPTEFLALDEALGRLSELDPRAAQLVELRFFGGMTIKAAAHCLDVSKATAENDWRFAKASLTQELNKGTGG